MRQFLSKFKIKMRKNVELFSFLKIDFSFFVLLLVMFFLDELKLFFIFVIFIFLHEFSHYFVAKKLGYLPSKIRLSIFGASLDGNDDFSFADEIKVVLAGPLLNFIFIILCYLSFWFNPESFEIFNDVLIVNFSIFFFNLLPIFPLDMGRLILAFLTKKYIRIVACKITKNISLFFVILLFIIYLISCFYSFNFRFGFVCINMATLCLFSNDDTTFKRVVFVNNKLKKLCSGLIERKIFLSNVTDYYALFKFVDDFHFTNFVIFDDKMHVIEQLSEIDLYRKFNFL